MEFKLFKSKFHQLTDEELMDMISTKNNEKAFEELYDRYNKKLLWFGMRIIGNKEYAEDIIHDTFLKIIYQPKLFNSQQKFSTWIYTIVKNACLSAIQNINNREELLAKNFSQVNSAYLVQTIDAKLLQKKLNAIYQTLNEKEQLIYILRFENELNIKEIAEIMIIPEGSVKSCLFYLLKKIAAQIKIYQEN